MTTSLTEFCARALPRLDVSQPLVTRELHDELYYDREARVMSKLLTRLRFGELQKKSKLVFSGHIGSGKSTELFNLKRTLEDAERATIVYWSVRDYVNMVGLNATGLLEGMARALHDWLTERQAGTNSDTFEEEIRRAYERTKRVRRHKEGFSMGASLGAEAGLTRGGGSLTSERNTTTEVIYEELPDPSAMLSLVNALIKEVRGKRREPPPVMLICDDLEKLDLKTAIRVFEDGLALKDVDACVIYTAPISLLYSEYRKSLLGHFDDEDTILPLVKVRDRSGNVVQESVRRLRGMLTPRLPDLASLVEDEAFTRAAVQCGGVFRDLLRMLRELCFIGISENRTTPFDVDSVRSAEIELRNSFLRQIPKELVPKLTQVANDRRFRGGGMDPELGRLLNLAAVLEYHNGETWYRLHPLTDHLLTPGSE